MSHTLEMYVRNSSSQTIKNFHVTHTWDGHANVLQGDGLAVKTTSTSQEITSGYTQYDWYNISLEFADAAKTVRTTSFYCNSSNDQGTVILEVFDDYIDCNYYLKKGEKYDTGCKNKSWY